MWTHPDQVASWYESPILVEGWVGFPVQHGSCSPVWGILWGGDPIPVHGSQSGMGLSAQCGGFHILMGVLSQSEGPSPAWEIPMWGSHLRAGVSHPSVVPACHGGFQPGMGVSVQCHSRCFPVTSLLPVALFRMINLCPPQKPQGRCLWVFLDLPPPLLLLWGLHITSLHQMGAPVLLHSR